MYLKSIEVQGFKSFANKIKFEFHNGITGIVGPNGSGKSNVADAVRWVLGEQRVKQLRGGNMQDVIFSGTENRKPLSYASVAITLDNSDHKLPVDYEEVTVARKLYRSGESAARIAHCAKVFAGISGGARTCTAAFYRKVPACDLACRMLMRRRCESIRVFAIDRIGIAAFHQPVCCQQSHYLLRRKVTFRQCTVCCSLDSRQVGNGLIQQGTQNICDHVELLACWFAF